MKVKINNLGSSGEGVGRHEGKPVFVDGALPDEVVEVELTVEKKTYSKGRLSQLLESSPHRIDPPCPVFGRCGGCQLQHLSYAQQLEAKRLRVEEALRRIGGFQDIQVEECRPSPTPYHYRNKIQLRAATGKNGQLELGLFAKGSHKLVTMDHCLIHCELGEQIFQLLRQVLPGSGVSAYDPLTRSGELRTVLVRTAVKTGQALLVFVTNGPASKKLREVSQDLLTRCPPLRGVVNNINTRSDNVILGEEYRSLAGDESIHETICGLDFKVSPASFFQVNPQQAEALYACAQDFAQLSHSDTLLDAYCGVGTLSLMMASQCQEVIGIECVPEAIEDAKANAERNGVSNARFRCGRAEELVDQLEGVDVVLMNPPRGGCDQVFLQGMLKLAPSRMVYISCDPATLARDLAYLKQHGYEIDRVRPYDMFPQTMHVETVVALSR